MGASIWPPPKAPEGTHQRRELPSNLHMAPRTDTQPSGSGHGTEGKAVDQDTSSAGHMPGPGSVHSGPGSGQVPSGRPRDAREDGEARAAGEGGGGGGGAGGVVLRRQDSAITGDSRTCRKLGLDKLSFLCCVVHLYCVTV